MPTVTGSWVPNGTTNQRMRLQIICDVPTPSLGQSSVTVTGSVTVQAGYSFSDSSNTFTLGGSLGPSYNGSKSVNVASGGTQTIHTFSQSVSLASGTQSKTVTASLTGVNYVGASAKASVSATITIPARVVAVPNTPSAMSAARVNDSRFNLNWTASATTDRPIASFEIQKWQRYTNKWRAWSNPGGSARSATDMARHPNDLLKWRIRARNAAGVSGWRESSAISTTPSVATAVKVARSGTSAVLTWTRNALVTDQDGCYQDVLASYSTDGGVTWSAFEGLSGHTLLSATITSRTLTSLAQDRQWRFRVQTRVPGPILVQSATSNVLTLLTPPNAPTLLAPLGIQSDQAPVEFRWRHNSVDTTGQTGYELRYRVDSGSWVTLTGSSTAADTRSVVLDAGQVEWQVRTRGDHASFGAWSSIAAFQVAAPPAVTITSPAEDAEIATNRLAVAWIFEDSQGASQTAWRAELVDGAGQTIESRSGTTQLTVAFRAELSDQSTYVYRLWVTSGTGLVATEPAEGTVTTAFIPPAKPTLEAIWIEEQGLTQVVVANAPGVSPASVDAVENRVERLADDGETWLVLIDGLGVDGGFSDAMVPLNRPATYRAIAISALGVETPSDPVTIDIASGAVWLSTEDGDMAAIRFNLAIGHKSDHTLVLEEYLDQAAPTAHFGVGRPRSASVQGVLVQGIDLGQDLAVFLGRIVYYRDPTGAAFWAALSEGVSLSQGSPYMGQVSITATEVSRG